ncbi:signal peptidase I [Paenibacillus sp. MMS18-CY102]|uniref:signal peptidase I n=1 Tax=Paenibacillus sp. MMS18-CY102 TaxID=2682849 RepID=UPI0013663542|nr:signal peptidase I [Paenibacillus sp. MMS18-CY102]MWC30415.1 signal peptidase I [Paenibacillus sp. MMS18-CY102]
MHDIAPLVAGWIDQRGRIELPSFGISMYPLIQQGNVSTFVKVSPEELRIGDVCLFITQQELMVAHRLRAIVAKDNETQYIFKGDTSYVSDDPVPYKRIIGRFVGVKRNGAWITADNWKFRLFSWLAMHMPKWPGLMNRYIRRRWGHA